jgi:oligoribonuclease
MERAYVWADLETTDYKPGHIVEAAFIVTDANLNEQGTFHTLVSPPPKAGWNPKTWAFHEKTGLIDVLHNSEKLPSKDLVEHDVASFLGELLGQPPEKERERSVFLAGNSVHFDHLFLSTLMPSVNDFFHYRRLDVSAIRMGMEIALGKKIELKEESTHRALADIRGSIKLYKELFGGFHMDLQAKDFAGFSWDKS